MSDLIVKKPTIPVKSTGPKECPCCGFNTNLLSGNDKKVDSNGEYYCRLCVFERSKRKVTQKDFYELLFDHYNHPDIVKQDYCTPKKNLPGVEVAHLCGKKYKEYVYLDMYYDSDDKRVFFRLCCSDDDESSNGYDSMESFLFISIDEAIAILNKNDIHFFDGHNDQTIFDSFVLTYLERKKKLS